MRDQQHVVTEQYNPVAQAYLTSQVHAQGPDLQALATYAQARPGARILDLGCGAGHVSFTVAPFAGEVMAYDLSEQMLSVVQQEAVVRKLGNIHTRQGAVESLPFDADSFDLILTRYSTHHWMCIQKAIKEMRRVLKPGGMLIVIDTVSPPNALLTTYMQSIELLRDPSHVKNRSMQEWQAVLEQEHFTMAQSRQWKLPLDFTAWVNRMKTPPERVAAIRSLLAVAPAEVLDYFDVKEDGSFTIDTAWMEARKSA